MKLSIIIPMYNAEKYIERCIESVYHQDLNLKDFEVIIINDGSIDNSLALVREMEVSYSNLFVIDKENGGQGAARNLGIEMALGDYIMFLDSDDYLVDYQIKNCLRKTIDNDLDVCCMRIQRLLPSGSPAKVTMSKFSEEEVYTGPWLLLHDYFPASVCAHFFRRDFLLKSNVRFLTTIMHEDVDFQLKLFSYIHRFMFCHVIVYIYYYNPESTDRMIDVNKQTRSILSTLRTCRDLIEFSNNSCIDYNIKLYYIKVSNSQIVALCLKLLTNNTLSRVFRRQAIQYAYINKLLPIKGNCFSWKSNILKPFINFWSSILI